MRIGIEAQRLFRPKKHGMDIVALELIKSLHETDRVNEYHIFVKKDADVLCLKLTQPNFILHILPSMPYPLWEQIYLPTYIKKLNLNSYLYTGIAGFTFKDVSVNIPVGRTLYLMDSLKLSNTLKLSSGTFNTGNALILTSDIYATARIAKVEASATLTGNIRWQRLVGPFKSQSNYYIGIPIKGTRAILLDSFFTVSGFQAGQVPTINTWNETTGKWIGVKDSNTILSPGTGYRVLMKKEDISHADSSGFIELTGSPMIGNGTSNTGTLNIPVTKGLTGWNVVSNPYPCEIDWKAIAALNPDLEDAFYMWDGDTRTYRVYKGSGYSGAPVAATLGMTSMINSGQGFVVKAKTAGNFKLNEDVKRTDSIQPAFHRLASYPSLRITLRNENYYSDEAIVRFFEESTKSFDVAYDASKYFGTSQNIAAMAGNDYLTINTLPYFNTEVVVPLYVQANYNGKFFLDFSDMESFSPEVDIYLRDKETGSVTNIRKTFTYEFVANKLDTKSRFEIAFKDLNATMVLNYEINASKRESLTVHPNPAHHNTSFLVNIENSGQVDISVRNLNGVLIYSYSGSTLPGLNSINWNFDKNLVPAGIYYYSVNANDKIYSGKLVIE